MTSSCSALFLVTTDHSEREWQRDCRMARAIAWLDNRNSASLASIRARLEIHCRLQPQGQRRSLTQQSDEHDAGMESWMVAHISDAAHRPDQRRIQLVAEMVDVYFDPTQLSRHSLSQP